MQKDKENNYTVGNNVKIGKSCIIGNNVIIHDDTIIEDEVRIDDNAVIGKLPMRSVNSATTVSEELTGTHIGKGSLIGTAAVIYRGARLGNNVLLADMASIRENVTVGDRTIIGKGSTIENKVKIGKECKIQANVQIVPYSLIEDNVFISPGVMTSNDRYAGRTKKRFDEYKGVTLKKGSRLGVACITMPGIVVGEDAFVGGGSVVTKDVPPRTIVYGNPAKIVRDVPLEQLLENQ